MTRWQERQVMSYRRLKYGVFVWKNPWYIKQLWIHWKLKEMNQ